LLNRFLIAEEFHEALDHGFILAVGVGLLEGSPVSETKTYRFTAVASGRSGVKVSSPLCLARKELFYVFTPEPQ